MIHRILVCLFLFALVLPLSCNPGPEEAEPLDIRMELAADAPQARGFLAAGEAYRMFPENTVFPEPVEIRIPFDPMALPHGMAARDLRLYTADAAERIWREVPNAMVDAAERVLTARVEHFSYFMTGAPPPGSTIPACTLPGGVGVAYEGDTLPQDDPETPWTRSEDSPGICCVNPAAFDQSCTPGVTPCDSAGGGFLTLTKVGEIPDGHGMGYGREECSLFVSDDIWFEGNLRIIPDIPTSDCSAPEPNHAQGFLFTSDGERLAGLHVGRLEAPAFGLDAGDGFATFGITDGCFGDPPLSVVEVPDIDLAHTYTVRLVRGVGAELYIDGSAAPVLTTAYGDLPLLSDFGVDLAPGFFFRSERGVGIWDFVRYSVCGGVCPSDNEPPDCSGATASPGDLWPPNHASVDITVAGVTDPDGDPVSITIDGITSDEPNDALGSGNTSPDCSGVGTDTATVLRERAGGGNGRVYGISFTADDGNGGTCSGTVDVCIAHSQGQGGGCTDDGQVYDCTVE